MDKVREAYAYQNEILPKLLHFGRLRLPLLVLQNAFFKATQKLLEFLKPIMYGGQGCHTNALHCNDINAQK